MYMCVNGQLIQFAETISIDEVYQYEISWRNDTVQYGTSCAVVIVLSARKEFSKVAWREVKNKALKPHPEISWEQMPSRAEESRGEQRRAEESRGEQGRGVERRAGEGSGEESRGVERRAGVGRGGQSENEIGQEGTGWGKVGWGGEFSKGRFKRLNKTISILYPVSSSSPISDKLRSNSNGESSVVEGRSSIASMTWRSMQKSSSMPTSPYRKKETG